MTFEQTRQVERVLREAVDHREPDSEEIPRGVRVVLWLMGIGLGFVLAGPALVTFFGGKTL